MRQERYSSRSGQRRGDSARRCLPRDRGDTFGPRGNGGAALSEKVVLPTMTLSVFLRNPAKCRGPERSASGLRAGALPSAHPAGAAALHPAQRQEAMLLTAWLPALRGWCALVRSGAGGIARHEAGYGIMVLMSTKEHQQPKLSSASSRSSSSGSSLRMEEEAVGGATLFNTCRRSPS